MASQSSSDSAPDARTEPAARGEPRRTGLLRALLYSFVPLAMLLLLAEVALWAAGLGDPDERLNLTRGFDENASYILPDGPPGAWRTQMFDGETPEVRIPPKDGRRRVLLFGGSNTELFPAEYLAEQLALADPHPGWEVINLGRRGYGSERVRILLRQALVTAPDVVVIYSGHNEFVEGEFALELEQEWSSPLLMGVARGLGRLRVMNVLSGLAKAGQAGRTGDGRPPEVRTERLDTFAGITFDRTLLYYRAYEQNLRAMCRAAREAGARVVLCTVVSNMLDVPSVAASRPDLRLPELVELARLGGAVQLLLPTRMTRGLMNGRDGQSPIRLGWESWRERNPGDNADRVEPRLRPLYGALAGEPLWNQVRSWTMPAYILMHSVEQLHRRELDELERQQVRQAVGLCERMVEIDPANALAIHLLGLALYISGADDARAVQLLQLSTIYDLAPNAANLVVHDIVRRVAASTPDVVFLDAQACFAERCPDGLVGYEVMMDNCHLHAGARRVLMRDLVPEILRAATR